MKTKSEFFNKKQAVKLSLLIIYIVTILLALSGMTTAALPDYGNDKYSDDYIPDDQQVLLINNSNNIITGLWEGNHTGVYYYNNSSGSTSWEKESGVNNKTIAIQRAVDNSTVENGTIIVGDGLYNGSLIIDNPNVTELKSDTNKPVIDGLNTSYTLRITVDNVNVSGFNLTNSSNNAVNVSMANKTNFINNNITDSERGIFLLKSNDSTIKDSHFTDIVNEGSELHRQPGFGIILGASNKTNVSNNTFKDNDFSIALLKKSNYNNLINNTILHSFGAAIITFNNSKYNNITDNYLADNEAGIILRINCSKNNVTGNEIINSNDTKSEPFSGVGLFIIGDCDNNKITRNKINNSSVTGIFLEYSSKSPGLPDNNLIYNNYLNNTDNVYVNDSCTGNEWNITKTSSTNIIGGPYLGGNYWANRSGDGFSQTNSDKDGDGICDSAYTINSNADSVDELPLNASYTVNYAGGRGTEDFPYEITNWTHLNNTRDNLDANFTLVNDLNETTDGYDSVANETANGGAGFEPIGNDSNKFTGTFDGKNHTITGLHIDRPSTEYVGLFGYTNSSEISNVGLEDINVNGSSTVGGLVGQNYQGTVNYSYSTGNVNSSGNFIGGLVGFNEGGTVKQSYSTGNVNSSGDFIGGLVGDNTGSSVINQSYSTGYVNGSSHVGGLVGYNFQGTVNQSYSTGNVTGDTDVGGLVGSNFDTVTDSYWDTETSGQDTSDGGHSRTTVEMKGNTINSRINGWDFETVWDFENVNGVVSYPYLQKNPQKPAPGKEKIYENGNGTTFNPYEIANWTQLNNTRRNPLANFALVEDLSDTTTDYNSIVTQPESGFTPIDNPMWPGFEGNFDGQGHMIKDLIIDRPNEDEVGLFKESSSTIENLVLKNVTITGRNSVGGVAGKQGFSPTTVKNVTVTGTVNGTDKVGGAVGYLDKDGILNTTTDVIVNGTDRVGGLVGHASWAVVRDSNSTGQVNGTTNVGGLVGYNEKESPGTIRRSYSTAKVNGTTNVGGLVGYNNNDLITQSYATGSVNGVTNVGGLIGNTTGSKAVVNLSYSAGKVTGDTVVGGLIGTAENGAVVEENAYWDTETTNQSSSAGGIALTTSEMKGDVAKANMEFDFECIWTVNTEPKKSYPYLREIILTPTSNKPSEDKKETDETDNSGRVSVGQNMPNENVRSSDSKQKAVLAGQITEYDFGEGEDSVKGISFESKENMGRVIAKVQTLDKLPDDVKSPTETGDSDSTESGEKARSGSKTYSTMSITVGSEGTVSEDNSDNILIEFEVTKEWVKNNNIDPSTIRMERYHNGEWHELPTNKEAEDEKYLHFNAFTPGFSIFSVVGDEIEETGIEEEGKTEPKTETSDKSEPENETDSEESTPGFTSLLALIVLGTVYLVLKRK